MYVIIMGGGRVGLALANLLINDGYDITLIESNESLCNEIAAELDALVICGNGTNSKLLEETNIEDADYFIATTGNDEANLLSCILVRKYEVPNIIARVSNPDHEEAFIEVGIDQVISPEITAASQLQQYVTRPNVAKLTTLGEGDADRFEVFRAGIGGDDIEAGDDAAERSGKVDGLRTFDREVAGVEESFAGLDVIEGSLGHTAQLDGVFTPVGDDNHLVGTVGEGEGEIAETGRCVCFELVGFVLKGAVRLVESQGDGLDDGVCRYRFDGFGGDGLLSDGEVIGDAHVDGNFALDAVLFDGAGCGADQRCGGNGREGLEVSHNSNMF